MPNLLQHERRGGESLLVEHTISHVPAWTWRTEEALDKHCTTSVTCCNSANVSNVPGASVASVKTCRSHASRRLLFRISAVGCMLSPCCGSFQASCSEWNGKVQTNPANLLARSINSTRPMLCATTLQARGRTPRHRSYKAIVKLWRNRGEGRSTTSELVSPN